MNINVTVIILLFLMYVDYCNSFLDPLSAFGYVAGTAAVGTIIGYFYRTCQKPNKIDPLKDELQNVYGQDIAIEMITAALKMHLFSKMEPKHALSIVMVGGTGTGKNYVAGKIGKFLFGNEKARHIIYFPGNHFFDSTHINTYSELLKNSIKSNVSLCPYSLFIFDEVDKMPAGLIDVIKPFLDYNSQVDQIDFRSAIFLFLANEGGKFINSKYRDLLDSGIQRSNMKYDDYEKLLQEQLYENDGLFYGSRTISQSLISFFVPFLPMDQSLVEKCIEEEFRRNNYSYNKEDIDDVLTYIYFDEELSSSGCKRVVDFVRLIINIRKE